MMQQFSWKERDAWLREQAVYDLLVIGGGITGAGILLDAQSRGLKAMLVEMQDFAAGTSSRSTKLIHGGLRYLKNLEFGLVAEVGRERAIVYENGPHVTRAEPMLIPIIKDGSLGKLSTGLGVWMYDRLAGVQHEERRKVLNAAETAAAEPLLDRDLLQAGILYYEYRTDDSRLTIETLKKAVELGGRAVNYARVTGFIYESGKVTGATVHDHISGESHNLRARFVVNSAGPWVDKVMELDDPRQTGKLFLTKGVHLVVDHTRLPVKQSAYFDTADKRMIFVIPREGRTYFGTTDTPYSGDIGTPAIDREDADYLLASVNRMFPGVNLREQDLISGWAGLRPLIRQAGKSPSEISRKDEIFVNASGLISIAGGKLTGFRRMAQKILDLVVHKASGQERLHVKPCRTEHLTFSGGDVGGSPGFRPFVLAATEEGKIAGLDEGTSRKIAEIYGSNCRIIYQLAREGKEEASQAGLPPGLYARLKYAVLYELALAPSDFFVRRTSTLYFHPEELNAYREKIIAWMKDMLHWSGAVEKSFRDELALHVNLSKVR